MLLMVTYTYLSKKTILTAHYQTLPRSFIRMRTYLTIRLNVEN